ncbi:MAG: hypothetical protein ACLQF1_21390 [Methyloceanibacter sp.]
MEGSEKGRCAESERRSAVKQIIRVKLARGAMAIAFVAVPSLALVPDARANPSQATTLQTRLSEIEALLGGPSANVGPQDKAQGEKMTWSDWSRWDSWADWNNYHK